MSRIDDIFNNEVELNESDRVSVGLEDRVYRYTLVMSVKYKQFYPDVMRKYFRKFRRIFEYTPEVINYELLEIVRPNFSSENFVKMFAEHLRATTGVEEPIYTEDELIDFVSEQLSGERYLKPSVTYGFNWQWTTPERAFLFIAALADVLIDIYSESEKIPAFNLYKDGFENVILWNEIDKLHTLINPSSEYKKFGNKYTYNNSLASTLIHTWELLSDVPKNKHNYELAASRIIENYSFKSRYFKDIQKYWHPKKTKKFTLPYNVVEPAVTERIFKDGNDKNWTVSLHSDSRREILFRLEWMQRVLSSIEHSQKNRMMRFGKKCLHLCVNYDKLNDLCGFFELWIRMMPSVSDTYDYNTGMRKVAVDADRFAESLIKKYGSLKKPVFEEHMTGEEMMNADLIAGQVMGEIFTGMKDYVPEYC